MEAFSDALRREMKPWNVKVVIMEPGGYSTAILNVENKRCMWKKQWDELNTDIKEEYGEDYFNGGKYFLARLSAITLSVHVVIPLMQQTGILHNRD